METPQRQLITYREAAQRAGLTERTMKDRLRESGIPRYKDGVDRRYRLLDVDDLPRLIEVRPVEPETARKTG